MKTCLRHRVLFFLFVHFMVGTLRAEPKADAIIGVIVMRADHRRVEELTTARLASSRAEGLLSAIMTGPNTEIISLSQLRASDEKKTRLQIGSGFPSITAEITPQVHDREEVLLHIEITTLTVKQNLFPGDPKQPLFTKYINITDQRLRDGDVDILNGFSKTEDLAAFGGIPGLVYVPVLGRNLNETGDTKKDLLIAVTPYVVRTTAP